MPTTQPRYTVTDSGAMRDMLDLAQRRWPEIHDRRQLLLRLAEIGAGSLVSELDGVAAQEQRRLQREALGRAAVLIDTERLLADAAWR